MSSDLTTAASTLMANSPVTAAGTSVAAVAVALYLVTRAPEFLVMTATAAVYATVAALPWVGVQ